MQIHLLFYLLYKDGVVADINMKMNCESVELEVQRRPSQQDPTAGTQSRSTQTSPQHNPQALLQTPTLRKCRPAIMYLIIPCICYTEGVKNHFK